MLPNKEKYYYLGFLIIAFVAFWQIGFLQFVLKYDMIDCSYPWRFIVAEHLQNGKLPLWNPYQSLGYPLFADIQSGASWYLPVWVLGFLFGYNIYTLSFEFIFHIFMSACGMYLLGKTLNISRQASFIMGIIYMLSGFFVGNAQHFTLIAGATWLPFVLSGYFNIIRKASIKTVFTTSFFLFMLISGGYPTYIVTTFYLLIAVFLLNSFWLLRKKDFLHFKKFILNNIILVIMSCCLSLVVLLSTMDISPELTRTEGLDLKATMLNPFSPQSLISFLLPYAAVKNLLYFNTDMSMTNAYIGIIPLIFLLSGLLLKQGKTYYFFLTIAVFFLIVAMGDYLPLRKILFDHVPLMNMFRFPAVFRLFTVLGFIVCIGFSFDHYLKNHTEYKRHNKYLIVFLIIAFLGVLVYSRAQGYLEIKKFILNDIFRESSSSSFLQHLAFQSVVQISILICFLIFCFYLKKTKHLFYVITTIIIFDMLIATQLNAPYTVYFQDFKQKEVADHHKNNFVKGFPVISQNIIKENNNANLSYGPFWRNLTIFHKQISQEGFTSLVLKNYRNLIHSYPPLFENVLENPPIFLTNNVTDFEQFQTDSFYKQNSKHVYTDNTKILFDKTEETPENQIEILSFEPDKIAIQVTTEGEQLLVLQQNYYKGWTAWVNDDEAELIIVNKALMGVVLKEKDNTVVFSFKKPLINFGFYVSVCSLLFLLSYYIFIFLKALNKEISGNNKILSFFFKKHK